MNKFFTENRPIFKGGREQPGGLLPRLDRRGANCSESARQKFNAQESWDARGKLSQRILSGEELVCGPEEKAEAKEQLKRYVAVKKFEIDRKYEEQAQELLKGKSGDELEEARRNLDEAKLKEKAVYEAMLENAALLEHFDTLPADEKALIAKLRKLPVGNSHDKKSRYINALSVRGGKLSAPIRAFYYSEVGMRLLDEYESGVVPDVAEDIIRKSVRILAAAIDKGGAEVRDKKVFADGPTYGSLLRQSYCVLAKILELKQQKSGKMNAPDDKVQLFYKLGGYADYKQFRKEINNKK